jgi:hypothetical protein
MMSFDNSRILYKNLIRKRNVMFWKKDVIDFSLRYEMDQYILNWNSHQSESMNLFECSTSDNVWVPV